MKYLNMYFYFILSISFLLSTADTIDSLNLFSIYNFNLTI